MSWQEKLGDLFSATVNQQSLEEAAEIMVSVSEDDIEYHKECVSVLEKAIHSCGNGSIDAISEINRSGYQVNSIDAAKKLLEDFLGIYLKEYELSQEG